MPQKIAVLSIASRMEPFVHVMAARQRGLGALEDYRVADAGEAAGFLRYEFC